MNNSVKQNLFFFLFIFLAYVIVIYSSIFKIKYLNIFLKSARTLVIEGRNSISWP